MTPQIPQIKKPPIFNQKKNILYWLILGVVVLVAGAMIWWSGNKSFEIINEEGCIQITVPMRNQATGECKIFLTPCDVPSSGWVGDKSCESNEHDIFDTSAWQTYQNEEYGFELKYLPESTIQDKGEITEYFKDENTLLVVIVKNKNITPEKEDAFLDYTILVKKTNYANINEWFEKEGSKAPYRKNNFKKIQFANKSAIEINSGGPFFTREIYTINNGYLYEILAMYQDIQWHWDNFNQILSTFRFLD